MSAADYLLGSLKETPRDSDTPFSTKDLGTCIPGFAAMNIPSRAGSPTASWVLGDLFLSKYYLSFDRKDLRVGIATTKTGPTMEERVKKAEKARRKAQKLSLL